MRTHSQRHLRQMQCIQEHQLRQQQQQLHGSGGTTTLAGLLSSPSNYGLHRSRFIESQEAFAAQISNSMYGGCPPVTTSSFVGADLAAASAVVGVGGTGLPLTTVSESANENDNNPYYEDFLAASGAEANDIVKRENADDDDDDADLLKTIVDPMTVGGFSSVMPSNSTAMESQN